VAFIAKLELQDKKLLLDQKIQETLDRKKSYIQMMKAK